MHMKKCRFFLLFFIITNFSWKPEYPESFPTVAAQMMEIIDINSGYHIKSLVLSKLIETELNVSLSMVPVEIQANYKIPKNVDELGPLLVFKPTLKEI
jgi:hypothetical protein